MNENHITRACTRPPAGDAGVMLLEGPYTMESFSKALKDRHCEASLQAKKYTRLLLVVIGMFVIASVLMKYGAEIVAMMSPSQYAETTLAQSAVPDGYWNVQVIGQIGLAVLAIYFGQVIATFSKYFHKKADYYERLILLYQYSEANGDLSIFTNEFSALPTNLGIGEFPKNPLQAFTEAVKSKQDNNQHNKQKQTDA